jgi:hypothetical protein
MGKWFPGAAVTVLLAMAGGLWHLSGETADTKRRVETVEERQKEDRKEARAEQKEIKQDVKDVKNDVQQIRLILERMQRGK